MGKVVVVDNGRPQARLAYELAVLSGSDVVKVELNEKYGDGAYVKAVLDAMLLKPDEIWFVEKEDNNAWLGIYVANELGLLTRVLFECLSDEEALVLLEKVLEKGKAVEFKKEWGWT